MRTLLISCLFFCLTQTVLAQTPSAWKSDFPKNAFDNWLVDPAEILEGGPGRDGIPAIDKPTFIPVGESDLAAQAPVIALEIEGVARAYPLEILIWHEIVNDEVADLPIAVTYCPLCNAALVFRRELEGRLLDFGTTGRLRKSDLVMYDRQTESWWQQFEGRALVGELAGSQLTLLPSRLEGFASFKARFPDGAVLARPAGFDRPYGMNPYDGYDSLGPYPGFADLSALPEDLAPMTYVIAVGNEAWPLERLQREGRIEEGDLILQWTPGAASALDSQQIDAGRDLGNVVVMKGGEDQVYDLTFAFVFLSFRPEGVIHFQ